MSWWRIQSCDSLLSSFLPHLWQMLKDVIVAMLVYSLSLWKNFVMHGFMNVERTVSVLCTFEWTLLHVGSIGSGELFWSEDFSLVSVLCMWTVHSSSHVFFERNSEFSLKALAAYLDMDLLLLLFPEYAEHKFGSSAMHVQFVLQNALNWPRWNYHQTALRKSNSCIFEDPFLQLIQI